MAMLWLLVGFLVYFVVVPFFLIELALNRPKKTEDGMLRIKKNGFVVSWFYRTNSVREEESRLFPKNLCQLHWGIICALFFNSFFCAAIVFSFIVITAGFYVLVVPLAVLAGFLPRASFLFDVSLGSGAKLFHPKLFHPYERTGGGKKWKAPWKFVLSMGLIALIFLFYREIGRGVVKSFFVLSSNAAVIIYGSITGIVFLILIINKIRKKESFVATKETIVSFVKKICKKIELT